MRIAVTAIRLPQFRAGGNAVTEFGCGICASFAAPGLCPSAPARGSAAGEGAVISAREAPRAAYPQAPTPLA
ncbi:MAG: hypothetical protein QM676_14900 [Novosphingobium sp.]